MSSFETTAITNTATEAHVVNIDQFTIGQQHLEAQGFSPEVALRMATIQMNAGGKCVGTFAEYIAVPDHAQSTERVVNRAKTAAEKGEDPVEMVYDRLDVFLERDENDNVVHASVEPMANDAESKKKVILTINSLIQKLA